MFCHWAMWLSLSRRFDGDVCITQSSTMLRYVARKYCPEVYPTDPVVSAKVDEMLDTVEG